MMNRGVAIDNTFKEAMREQFTEIYNACLEKINYIFDEEVNLNSTPQVRKAFKELLGIEPIKDRKRKTESFNGEAMLVYLERYTEYRALLTLFLETKSIKVFLKTFLSMKLSDDSRLRCSYNHAGTKTYRFSSRKSFDGTGGNLSNIPSKGKIDLRYALEEIDLDDREDYLAENPIEQFGKTELPNCKKMFIPDRDYIFFDADYSAIDLHFVVWESDCQFLKDIIKAGKDVYSILASYYYEREISKKDKERQIFKAICHGCVTADHEVLTKDGWITVDTLQDNQEIMVWNKEDKSMFFEVPRGINRDFVEKEEELFSITGSAFSFLGTQDHKFPATTDKPENLKVYKAVDLPKSARIPYNGNYIGGSLKVDENIMRLMAALQADGNISHIALNGDITFRFKFVRERKIERMRYLLDSLNIGYKEWTQIDASSNGNLRTCFSFKNILEEKHKKLGWWILEYCRDNLLAWKDELKYWDGHIRKNNGIRTSISSTDKVASEIMQTIIHITGQASKVSVTERDSSRKLFTKYL